MTLDENKHHDDAVRRLSVLGLPADLISDESGQTGDGEHVRWLATATDDEILSWARQLS